MSKKGYFDNVGQWVFDPAGKLTAPVDSTLPHRFFQKEDGKVGDKYDGVTDEQVRILDHEEAQARVDAAQAAWDAADEEERKALGPRVEDLPPLDLP